MSKRVFQGWGLTGIPDLDTSMGIWRLPFVSRTNTVAANGWTDVLTLPTTAWYDALAAAYTNTHNWLLIDHESYPVTTPTECVAASLKFVTIYNEMKTRRPDLSIGFYGHAPISDVWAAWASDSTHTDWQALNDGFATLWATVDAVFPSIYFFYDRVTDDPALADAAHLYFSAMCLEATRLRTAYAGGRDVKIYPYVWHRRHDDAALLDTDVWADMLRIAQTEADGMIFWSGAGTWDEEAYWWSQVKSAFPWGDNTVLKTRTAASARTSASARSARV